MDRRTKLQNVPSATNSQPTSLGDLPIRNVLSEYLNTRSTRALAATSKSVSQELDDGNQIGNQFYNASVVYIIEGKPDYVYPYNECYAVVFSTSSKEIYNKLGFASVQYVFAYEPDNKAAGLRLIDLQVLSLPQQQQHLKKKTELYFNYTLLHRHVMEGFWPAQLDDVSNKSFEIEYSIVISNNYDSKTFPDMDKVRRRFQMGDKLYRQLFIALHHKAKETLKYETDEVIWIETPNADEIGDLLDMYRHKKVINGNQSGLNNTVNNNDRQLQNAKRRARAQVLGEYNSKLKAPFTTSQAISRFLDTNSKPKGKNVTRLIAERASNLERQAQARVANVIKDKDKL